MTNLLNFDFKQHSLDEKMDLPKFAPGKYVAKFCKTQK